MTAASARRAQLLRLLADRDDGDVCFYCVRPLVLPDRVEDICTWRPTEVFWDHCGCGKHQVGVEPCVLEGYWAAPDGYDFAQIDHVLPQSRGGSDDPVNLVLSCGLCNSRKGTKTPGEWLAA